jgi:hypothetical protein
MTVFIAEQFDVYFRWLMLSKASLKSKVTSAIFSLDCFIEQLCINTTRMLCTNQKSQCGDVMDAGAGIRWWAARCNKGLFALLLSPQGHGVWEGQ